MLPRRSALSVNSIGMSAAARRSRMVDHHRAARVFPGVAPDAAAARRSTSSPKCPTRCRVSCWQSRRSSLFLKPLALVHRAFALQHGLDHSLLLSRPLPGPRPAAGGQRLPPDRPHAGGGLADRRGARLMRRLRDHHPPAGRAGGGQPVRVAYFPDRVQRAHGVGAVVGERARKRWASSFFSFQQGGDSNYAVGAWASVTVERQRSPSCCRRC